MPKSVDLSKLSYAELEELRGELETEIVTRRETERVRVLQQVRELAGSVGLSLEDLVRGKSGAKAPAARGEARYRHPDNPSLTWAGRGRRPAWVEEQLSAGKTLDDLAAK
jgi:DNA-binding protein H-NS